MKTTTIKNESTSTQPSTPFFRKSGNADFSSPSKEITKPFFSPAIVQSKLNIGQSENQHELTHTSKADMPNIQREPEPQNEPSDSDADLIARREALFAAEAKAAEEKEKSETKETIKGLPQKIDSDGRKTREVVVSESQRTRQVMRGLLNAK